MRGQAPAAAAAAAAAAAHHLPFARRAAHTPKQAITGQATVAAAPLPAAEQTAARAPTARPLCSGAAVHVRRVVWCLWVAARHASATNSCKAGGTAFAASGPASLMQGLAWASSCAGAAGNAEGGAPEGKQCYNWNNAQVGSGRAGPPAPSAQRLSIQARLLRPGHGRQGHGTLVTASAGSEPQGRLRQPSSNRRCLGTCWRAWYGTRTHTHTCTHARTHLPSPQGCPCHRRYHPRCLRAGCCCG